MSMTFIDDPKDMSYQLSGESQSTSQSLVSAVSVVNDRKFIVFEAQLDELFCHLSCPICHCPCSTDDLIKSCNEGTVLHVVAQCVSGHIILDWLSQPLVGRPVPPLCSVNRHFDTWRMWLELLNLKFVSHTTFYHIQRNNLIPIIMAAWKTHQQSMFTELRRSCEHLRVCGDGRMDSPGFSAKYCTYTLMDMTTDKILTFAVVDVTEAGGSSTNMAVLAFERCLRELLDSGFTVDVVATDRHVQVRNLLETKYPSIKHQFDVWHDMVIF